MPGESSPSCACDRRGGFASSHNDDMPGSGDACLCFIYTAMEMMVRTGGRGSCSSTRRCLLSSHLGVISFVFAGCLAIASYSQDRQHDSIKQHHSPRAIVTSQISCNVMSKANSTLHSRSHSKPGESKSQVHTRKAAEGTGKTIAKEI